MRAIIVYDSWYGDTRRVAEEIGRGFAEVTGDDPSVVEVDQVAPAALRRFDLIIIGTPNHFGRATRKTRELLRVLGEAGPLTARFAVFDTCFEAEVGKASLDLAEVARRLAAPGSPAPLMLSTVVESVRGPLHPGELARAHRFGAELARSVRPAVAAAA